jgi:hypothetical protein
VFYAYQEATMDWARAIERNSVALKAIVEALFAMLGLAGDATIEYLPGPVRRAVLRILRPAESAVRRLVVIAARGLVVKPSPSHPMPKEPIKRGKQSRLTFKLFDPRKSSASLREATPIRMLPRIHIFGNDPRVAAMWASSPPNKPTPPIDDVDKRLVRRLQALKAALDDLPRQARRLARWRERRQGVPSLKFKSPLRPGPPPGHRRKKTHEIDEILTECHGLAWDALKLDTS